MSLYEKNYPIFAFNWSPFAVTIVVVLKMKNLSTANNETSFVVNFIIFSLKKKLWYGSGLKHAALSKSFKL